MPTINQKIFDIAESLDCIDNELLSIRLRDGLLGISLFYIYLADYMNDDNFFANASFYLNTVFERLNSGNGKDFEVSDLIDIGRYSSFLYQQNQMQIEDINLILKELTPHIATSLKDCMLQKDFGSVLGMIAHGFYYLDNYSFSGSLIEIESIIKSVDLYKITDADGSYHWIFSDKKYKHVIRLGITNGIAGVIYFLIKALELNIMPEQCKRLIEGSVQYILKFEKDVTVNRFPYAIQPEPHYASFQDIAYGDVGIGHVLYNAGVVMANNIWLDKGLITIKNAALFRDDQGSRIKDAALLHGASGLLAIFHRYYLLTKEKLFADSVEYWLSFIEKYRTAKNQWAGYETYYGGDKISSQWSFAYGIAGIGTALICYEKANEHPYLSLLLY